MSRPRNRSTTTIVEVAAAAGVSMKTVSRVLNREGLVRDETADKVRGAAARLGYTVNLSAQRLARGRSHNIGILLVAGSNWQRTGQLVAGALAPTQARGYGLVPHVIEKYEGDERSIVLALKARKAVDGLLLTVPWSENARLLEDLAEHGVPHVCITGPGTTGHISVRSADEAAAYSLTRYLLDLGHRKISVVGGQPHLNVTRERLAGYRRAMSEAGIDPDCMPHVFGDYLFATGYNGAAQLLTSASWPTALFCLTDALAAGAMRQAHERGVPVPGTMSIVGFGDSGIADTIWPTLTAVAVPTADLAAMAASLLMDLIEGKTGVGDILLPAPLVVRASSGRGSA